MAKAMDTRLIQFLDDQFRDLRRLIHSLFRAFVASVALGMITMACVLPIPNTRGHRIDSIRVIDPVQDVHDAVLPSMADPVFQPFVVDAPIV